jgi:hypothetical protein
MNDYKGGRIFREFDRENLHARNQLRAKRLGLEKKWHYRLFDNVPFWIGVFVFLMCCLICFSFFRTQNAYRGTIIAKEHRHGYWFNTDVNKNGHIQIVPDYQPQAWLIKIKTGDSIATRYVTQAAYDTLKINKVIPLN